MANGLKRVQYRSDFVPPSDCDTVYYAEKDDEVAYMRIAAALLVLADDSRLRIGSPIIGNGYISTPQYDECGGSEGTVDTENGISLNDIKSLILPDETVFLYGETNQLFMNCTALEHIELPSNLENLGEWMFSKCSGLTSITIPESVSGIGEYAFSNCTSLTSIELPGAMTAINEGLFENCTGLTNIVIPSGVTSVYDNGYPNYGTAPFEGCSNLTSITLGEGMSEIPSHLFDSCTALESVEIPESITHLGDRAFNSCSNLSSITLHEGLLSIDAYYLLPNTHYGEESVGISLSIPDSVSSITGDFQYSTLVDVTVGSGVTSLEYGIFANCPNLTRIVITGNITEIPSYFVGWLDNSSGNPHSPLRSFDVPESVTSINFCGFYYCENLSGITMHEGLLEIGDRAFYCCENLSTITIPSTVTTIGKNCFVGCTNLTAIYYTGSATGFPWGASNATLNPT